MKQKHNGGFSLIETVVAIAILGLIVVPCCSGLLMSIRINEKAQQMMQAQLAVSSAVETLMAEGIDANTVAAAAVMEVAYDEISWTAEGAPEVIDRFPEVTVNVEQVEANPYYNVKVTCGDLVEVTTTIREAVAGS